MTSALRIGIVADVHGEYRLLEAALDIFRNRQIDTLAILGDLFDRVDQADRCVAPLTEWNLIGIYGNHELEALQSSGLHGHALHRHTVDVLSGFQEQVDRFGARFLHDPIIDEPVNPLQAIRGERQHTPQDEGPRIIFYGHTHHRQLRDEKGSIDIHRGCVRLNGSRRYYANPGPLAEGQYMIWDRQSDTMEFLQVT